VLAARTSTATADKFRWGSDRSRGSCERIKLAADERPKKQLLTYLRLPGKRLGLPINFNGALIRDGITRLVNDWEE